MSDIGEAIGTAAEGSLFARAVDGKDGRTPITEGGPQAGHFAESQCLNCGTTLVGTHCHCCGQKAHLHRTLGAFMHDLLHGALHFEGKMWSTLPKLVLKPGELTRRYIAGERAKFVSPMALFLFTVFLMFAVFQAAGLSVPADIGNDPGIAKALEDGRSELIEERADLETELGEAETAQERQAIETELAAVEKELASIDEARRVFGVEDETADDPNFRAETANRAIEAERAADADPTDEPGIAEKRLARKRAAAKGGGITVTGDSTWPFLQKLNEKWRANPSLMLYKLQSNGYKFSWLLIPLSIPFVWLLLLWKRKYKAYDHAIFVTYSLAFMSLLFIAVSLLAMVNVANEVLTLATVFIAPIHIYKQLRGAYDLSRFSALWRLTLLLCFIAVIISLFATLLTLLGAF